MSVPVVVPLIEVGPLALGGSHPLTKVLDITKKARKEKKLIIMLCDSCFPVVLPSVMWDKYLFWHFPHFSSLCGDSRRASSSSNHHLWFSNDDGLYENTIPELSGYKKTFRWINYLCHSGTQECSVSGGARKMWLEYRLQGGWQKTHSGVLAFP